MPTLPPVPPAVGWRTSLRLPRDHYVRLDANDYSVYPAMIGRRVEVVADLDRVPGVLRRAVGGRPAQLRGRHRSVVDPAHVAAARRLRRDRLSVLRPTPTPDVEIRCLADYDTVLGLDNFDSGVA